MAIGEQRVMARLVAHVAEARPQGRAQGSNSFSPVATFLKLCVVKELVQLT